MVKIYVNTAFVTYVASFFGVKKGDATYAAYMDLNSDGVIDIKDISAWAVKANTWIDVKPTTLQEWIGERPPLMTAGILPRAPLATTRYREIVPTSRLHVVDFS